MLDDTLHPSFAWSRNDKPLQIELAGGCGTWEYEVPYGKRSKRHRRSRFNRFVKLARDQEW